MSELEPEEQQLIDKRIVAVERAYDNKYLRLAFEDGTAATFYGSGYDGLWDDVYVTWGSLD